MRSRTGVIPTSENVSHNTFIQPVVQLNMDDFQLTPDEAKALTNLKRNC